MRIKWVNEKIRMNDDKKANYVIQSVACVEILYLFFISSFFSFSIFKVRVKQTALNKILSLI